jgi:thiamine monophosphate synthase
LRALTRGTRIPVVALGGIASEWDARRAIEAGARGIAIQRALLAPSTPAWAAQWLESRRTA